MSEEVAVLEPELTEESLLRAAAEADGIPYSGAQASVEEKPVETTPQQTTESPEKETQDSSDVKSELKADDPLKELEDVKDDKALKDRERLAKAWKKHTDEKLAWKDQQSSLTSRVQEYETKLKDMENQIAQAKYKYKPYDLRKWARDLEEKGDIETAKQARDLAIETEENEAKTKASQSRYQEEFKSTWESNLKRMIQENPDLGKEGSELRDAVQSTLKIEDPALRGFLHSTPNGIVYATEIAKMRIDAALTSDLRKENEELKNKLKERDRKLAPIGSVAVQRQGQKGFDELNHSDQGKRLLELAREADSSW